MKSNPTIPVVAHGRRWTRVKAAKAWRPRAEGAELVGTFAGRAIRTGAYGPYGVVFVRAGEAMHTLSGVVINGLFDAAMLIEGADVRVVFRGEQPAARGTYFDFELFVPEETMRLGMPDVAPGGPSPRVRLGLGYLERRERGGR